MPKRPVGCPRTHPRLDSQDHADAAKDNDEKHSRLDQQEVIQDQNNGVLNNVPLSARRNFLLSKEGACEGLQLFFDGALIRTFTVCRIYHMC